VLFRSQQRRGPPPPQEQHGQARTHQGPQAAIRNAAPAPTTTLAYLALESLQALLKALPGLRSGQQRAQAGSQGAAGRAGRACGAEQGRAEQGRAEKGRQIRAGRAEHTKHDRAYRACTACRARHSMQSMDPAGTVQHPSPAAARAYLGPVQSPPATAASPARAGVAPTADTLRQSLSAAAPARQVAGMAGRGPMGQLTPAAGGEAGRANACPNLSRRAGGTATTRVSVVA